MQKLLYDMMDAADKLINDANFAALWLLLVGFIVLSDRYSSSDVREVFVKLVMLGVFYWRYWYLATKRKER